MGLGDFVSSALGKATDAVGLTPEAIELQTFKTVLPHEVATWVQNERRSLNIDPILPGTSSFFIFMAVAGIISTAIISKLYGVVMGIINLIWGGFTGNLKSKTAVFFFSIFVGFAISYGIYIWYVRPYLEKKGVSSAALIAKSISTLESFANPGSETSLLNLQTISVKQTAYVGPSEVEGEFDTSLGIQSAITAGIRVFILQIDYLDTAKTDTLFDAPLVPTLLYRNADGILISKNGANIGKVAESLAAYAFNGATVTGTQPLIVYLHFVRAPNALREPEKYIKYLSTVAAQLKPLSSYLIGSASGGKFQRQENELTLLQSPISQFQSKMILFCNADTSIFRNTGALGMQGIAQANDLDYMVNVRVYLDSSSDSLGVTSVPTNALTPLAVVVPFSRLIAMTEKEQDAFAVKGKMRFVFALPSQDKNPSVSEIKSALEFCNVNSIALNLFGEPIPALKEKMKLWGNEPFLKVKAPNYQTPIVQPNY
jgi:hypothetical protein